MTSKVTIDSAYQSRIIVGLSSPNLPAEEAGMIIFSSTLLSITVLPAPADRFITLAALDSRSVTVSVLQ